jgi:hypothetical protein
MLNSFSLSREEASWEWKFIHSVTCHASLRISIFLLSTHHHPSNSRHCYRYVAPSNDVKVYFLRLFDDYWFINVSIRGRKKAEKRSNDFFSFQSEKREAKGDRKKKTQSMFRFKNKPYSSNVEAKPIFQNIANPVLYVKRRMIEFIMCDLTEKLCEMKILLVFTLICFHHSYICHTIRRKHPFFK